MHPNDAKQVLACAAAYDKRTPSNAEAYTWGQDLGDITVADAQAAVREHFRTRPDTYLNVGHVIAIVKRYRRTGLDQSARLEHAALSAIDPDDPDYTSKCLDALHRARHAAATNPATVPGRPALPSRYELDNERAQRAHRGADMCRAVLAQTSRPSAEPERALTESERVVAAARERAVVERRAAKLGRHDPQPIASVMRDARQAVGR